MIPAPSSNARRAYEAARLAAAVVDRSDRGRIVVSGKDRAAYLHGLLTNDIAALGAGTGCYAAYLTPQGRMISDLWVYELGDVMLIVLGGAEKDAVLSRLDQFVFAEDVQLGDATETFTSAAVVGPRAAETVARILTDLPPGGVAALGEHENVRARFHDQPAIVLRVTDTGEPGYEVQVARADGQMLKAALAAAGAVEVDELVADVLRIEAGLPKFGRDMDENTIPLEAGIESRAISFTKGCYVGQEVIVRVLHRGHGRVARKLVGLMWDSGGTPPSLGAAVHADDRELGSVTSSVVSLALGRPIALAYVQRDFIAPGTPVTVEGVPAVVTALPFVERRSESRLER